MKLSILSKTSRRNSGYSDMEVVAGLQCHDRKTEEWFYSVAREYFYRHFNEIFFSNDQRQEIFQSSFLKLWTEIDNRRICIIGQSISRQQRNGTYSPMTCSLTTFLMAFAKNEYRELLRSAREVSMGGLFDNIQGQDDVRAVFDTEDDIQEQRQRIIDECIQQISPACIEILTLFYYKRKSLDEILEIRKEQNTSKNGLKTAKNKCMNTLRLRVAAEMQRYDMAM